MSEYIVEKSNNGLFENEIEINGKYATIVRYLKEESKIFTTFREVYITAAIIGFLKNKTETKDASEKVQSASIFTDQLRTRKLDIKFLFRVLMLVKEEPTFEIDDYMNRTFRDGSEEDGFANLKEKMAIFNSYVCGGLEFLYDRFYNLHKKDDIINSVYELIHEIAIDTGILVPEGLPDFDIDSLGE